MVGDVIEYKIICGKATQWSTLAATGGRVDSPLKREKPKTRQVPKKTARTHRQPHALLGGVFGEVKFL